MRKRIVILITVSIPLVALSFLAESSPLIRNQPLAGQTGIASIGSEPKPPSLTSAQQEDLLPVSSGQEISRTGLAQPEISSGPVYSRIPDLTPRQAAKLHEETEQQEPSVPVKQGRMWAEIPRPTDPPAEPVLGSSDLRKLSGSAAPQAANDFKYQQVTDLTTIGSSSLSEVNEPSVASMGSTLFFTGNWYAARSTDAGLSFTFVSPLTTFPSVNGGFCCDQVANYAPAQDMMLWEMQYLSDGTNNTIRIARAVGSATVASNSWISYKFTPQNFGFPNGTYLDFPNLTLGSTFLYLTENVYTSGGGDQDSRGTFAGSVIMRVPLSELAAGGTINYNYYAQSRSSADVASLRCAEGAGTTMYWAGWRTTSQLRIFHWDDSSSSIFWDDINTAAFTYMNRGEGVAPSPDGTNFAARADSRILGAWVANGVLGFMWAAKQDSTFPYPYTVVGRFDQSTRARLSQNAVWSSGNAWLYPAAAPNSVGNLAGLLAFGGGANYPGTNIWIVDDVESGFSPLGLHGSTSGTAGPASNKWGDYLTVRPQRDFPKSWVAAAYSLKNGGAGSNAVPRYLWFGRERDLGSSSTPTPTPTATPTPTPTATPTPTPTATPTPTPTTSSIQFSYGFYPVREGDGRVNITLTRSGNTSGAASVSFATNDAAGLQDCNVVNGIASPRCDYENTIGSVTWAAGDATPKTFSIAIVDDAYAEGNETFSVNLKSPSGANLGVPSTATVTIVDNDGGNGTNPIDNTNFFVRQQYIDFLGREPDPPGFAGWAATINNCAPGDTNCDRIHVSQLFFQSAEFQDRGYFVYRFYPVAFGRKPDYAEFVPDLASVSGFLDTNQLEAAKVAFIAAFMARPAFANTYNPLTNQQYVDLLLNTAGVTLSSRQAMINGLNGSTMTRGAVLRQIVESPEVSARYNHQAYAVMEYFGYLRRQPDGFYLAWIQALDQSNDPRGMVTGFMTSTEYRQRFGSSGSPTPTPTPTPAQLSITSLSSSSPLPMTPIHIGTTGINASLPVTVSFSNSAGFSASESAIRILPDGTVVTPVPLYLNPATKQIGPGTVSVVLTQSGHTTAPMTLNIQDLPSLSSYGTSLGQITHAKLVFDALLLGNRINQLQTFQALPGQTVNASAALQTLRTELAATIKARSDVDRVIVNNSVVIDGGTLVNGAVIKFDKNALEMMDRVNGLFLSQTLANLPAATIQSLTSDREQVFVSDQTTSAESARVVSRFKRNHKVPNFLRPRRGKMEEVSQTTATVFPLAGSSFGNFLNALKTITGVNEYVNAKFEYDESKNDYDTAKAMIAGADGYIEAMKGLGALDETRFAGLGMVSALFSTAETVGESYAQLFVYAHGVITDNQAEKDVAVQGMQANWDNGKLGNALVDLTLAFTGGAEGWVGVVSTVGSYVKSWYDLSKPGSDGTSAEGRSEQTSLDDLVHFPPGDTQDIGQITGGINITNNLGISAPQGEIELSNGGFAFDTLADPSGGYQMFVPLNVPGFNYGNVEVQIIDPLTGTSLGSEIVDLRNLNPSNPIQIPTLFGQCVDSDAGSPDGDDPDCD